MTVLQWWPVIAFGVFHAITMAAGWGAINSRLKAIEQKLEKDYFVPRTEFELVREDTNRRLLQVETSLTAHKEM